MIAGKMGSSATWVVCSVRLRTTTFTTSPANVNSTVMKLAELNCMHRLMLSLKIIVFMIVHWEFGWIGKHKGRVYMATSFIVIIATYLLK